jgi:hypothetical protein
VFSQITVQRLVAPMRIHCSSTLFMLQTINKRFSSLLLVESLPERIGQNLLGESLLVDKHTDSSGEIHSSCVTVRNILVVSL